MKITYSFKSKTIDGQCAKIYFTITDNVIVVYKVFLSQTDKHLDCQVLVRKFGDKYLFKEIIGLKHETYLLIACKLAEIIKN